MSLLAVPDHSRLIRNPGFLCRVPLAVSLAALASALTSGLVGCDGSFGGGSSGQRDLLAAVPADAAVVVSVADLDVIRGRAADSTWVELFRGDTWADIVAAARSTTHSDRADQPDVIQAVAALRGEFVGYVRRCGESLDPEFGFVAEASGEGSGVVEFWEALHTLASARGERETFDYRGATVRLVTRSEETAFFRRGDLVGMTIRLNIKSSTDAPGSAAKALLDRLDGAGGDSIADIARFKTAFKDRDPNAGLRVFLNGEPLFGWLKHESPDREWAMIESAGLNRMEWAMADFDLRAGEAWDAHVAVHIPSDSFPDDILAHLGAVPVDMAEQIPAGAFSMVLANIDVLGLFRTIVEFQRQVSPRDHARLVRNIEEMREELSIDLEQEVLASLSGRVALIGSPRPFSQRQMMDVPRAPLLITPFGPGFSGCVLVELDEVEPLKRALGIAMPLTARDGQLMRYEVDGIPVESIVGLPALQPTWTTHADTFLISLDEAGLRAALGTLTGSETTTFADRAGVADWLRDNRSASIASVVRTRGVAQTALGLLRALGAGYGRYGDAGPFASIRWPSGLVVPELFEGNILQAVKRSDDRLVWTLAGR